MIPIFVCVVATFLTFPGSCLSPKKVNFEYTIDGKTQRRMASEWYRVPVLKAERIIHVVSDLVTKKRGITQETKCLNHKTPPLKSHADQIGI